MDEKGAVFLFCQLLAGVPVMFLDLLGDFRFEPGHDSLGRGVGVEDAEGVMQGLAEVEVFRILELQRLQGGVGDAIDLERAALIVLPGVGDEVERSPVMDEVVGGDVEVSGPVAGVAVPGSTCGRTSWAFGSKAKPDDSRSAGACWRCSICR